MNRLLYTLSGFSTGFWIFVTMAIGVFIGFTVGVTMMSNFFHTLLNNSMVI